jgi:HK97 family phage major capsid protein
MGRMLNEAVNAETSAVGVTFTLPITLKAFKGTSDMVRMSREIMQDSYFNFQAELANLLAERMGRLKSYQFTKGAGTTAPHGLDTKIKATAALQVVPASNTAIARTDIVNTIYSVDAAYRMKESFKLMMHDQLLKQIVLMAIGTNDDRPLWTPGMAFGRPDTIEGVPYIVNNNMDSTLAKTKLSIIAGDMSKYVIRQVADRRVHVTEERFIDTDEVGIVMFERFDGQLLDAGTHPIVGLYHNRT